MPGRVRIRVVYAATMDMEWLQKMFPSKRVP